MCDSGDEIWLPSVHHDVPLSRAFARRSTCRDFSRSVLSHRELAGVLVGARRDDAGWAYPSAHNRRPVEVTVLMATSDGAHRLSYAFDPSGNCLRPRGHTLRERLSAVAHDEQPWLDSAPVVIVLEADIGPVASEFESQDPSGLRGRDFVMIESGTLAQNLLLGAAVVGVGAVLVAGLRQEACRDLLGTPRHVCSLIAVGHPGA